MTVSTTSHVMSYAPGSALAPQAIGFPFLYDTDLVVVHTAVATGVTAQLVPGFHYTISSNPAGWAAGTATITALGVYPAGDTFRVTRRTAKLQAADFVPGAPLSSVAIERELDRTTMISQELQAASDRAVKVPEGEVITELPPASQRTGGNKVLGPNAVTGAIEVLSGAGFKGDPGANADSIGLFTVAATLSIPVGTDTVRTSGWRTLGKGIADYQYDAAIDAAYVAAHPLSSFRTINQRGFRLVMRDRVHIDQFGAYGEMFYTGAPGDDTPAQLAMAAEHPVGATLVFGPNNLRVTAPITWTKFAYFEGRGARVIGDFGVTTGVLWTLAFADSENADARLATFAGFKGIYFATGGAGPLTALDVAGNTGGNLANIQFSFRDMNVATLDTSTTRAIRLRGLGTHFMLWDNCQVENGVQLECADNVRFTNCLFLGTKTALYYDLIYGSFGSFIQSCGFVARDGAIWVAKGTHITSISSHIEQATAYGENANTFKASVVVFTDGTQPNICRHFTMLQTGFGGGSNQDWPFYLVFGCDGFFIDHGMINRGDAGQDGAIAHATVRGTKIGYNIGLRGPRSGVIIDAFGNATANVLDPSELLSFLDTGTGTYAIFKVATLTGLYTSPSPFGFRWKKLHHDELQFDGDLAVGATLAANTVAATTADGFRPRETQRFAVYDRVNNLWVRWIWRVSGELEPDVLVTAGAIFDWSGVRRGVRGRITYQPGA